MGAGILPTTIHEGKLYFLFGKENKYADTPGWADFGGGTDGKETFLQTAVREGGEELTGFLGTDAELRKMLKAGTYNLDSEDGRFRIHIFPYKYNPYLPLFYNNNQRFLQKRLDPKVIKKTTIFEKGEIRWISEDELPKMRSDFRNYFQKIVDRIVKEKEKIRHFLEKSNKKRQTRNNKNKNKNQNKNNNTKTVYINNGTGHNKTRKHRFTKKTELEEPKKEWWHI